MSVHSAITNQKTIDGFNNVYRNISSKRDITQNTTYKESRVLSAIWKELDDLYSQNWIAAKAIDIPIDDAFKDDRIIQSEDAERLIKFENFIEEIELMEKIKTASKWARVFGGAFLIIVADDDMMDKPLNIARIPQGGLKNIAVLDRFDVFANELDRNPLSVRYLEPEFYQLGKTGAKIHYTRCIRFDGVETTNYKRERNNGFALSVFERLFQTILNADMSPSLLINLLQQSNIDVFKILGLNENLTGGDIGDSLVTKRLEAIMIGKSIFNGVALDKEDDYVNIAKNFAGLGDLNKEFYQVVSGAADIPFSRFMGASLTGLNPTGEGELKNYYDMVETQRAKTVKHFNTLDKVIMQHLFGEQLEYTWEFDNLFKMTPAQIADIESKNAASRVQYLQNGVVNELEVKAGLVDNPLFPSITAESYEIERKSSETIAEL